MLIAVLLLALMFAQACESERDPGGTQPAGAATRVETRPASTSESPPAKAEKRVDAGPHVARDAAASPGADAEDDDPIVARAGALEVHLSDYRRGLLRGAMLGRPYPETTKADPMFQRNLLERLLKRAAAEREASARGIAPSREALVAFAARQPALDDLEETSEAAITRWSRARGIPAEVFWQFAEEDYVVEKLTEALLAEIDDEALWERYQAEHTRDTIEVARFLNVPSPRELSAYVATHGMDIASYYAEHKNRYAQPALAHVRRIVIDIPRGGGPDAVAAAREEAEALRQRVLDGADMAALAREHSDDALTRGHGGRMQPVPRAALPDAFELEIGALSDVERRKRGFSFFKVEDRTPATQRELDAALEREIASRLLQREGAAPSVARAANQVLAAWRDGDEARARKHVETHKAELERVGPFPRSKGDRIPGLGRVPNVVETVRALDEDTPVASAPVLDGEYVYAVRLVERDAADRLEFEANKAAYREQVRSRERPRILWRVLDAAIGRDRMLDLRTIQRHYGVLRQDGTVERLGADVGDPR